MGVNESEDLSLFTPTLTLPLRGGGDLISFPELLEFSHHHNIQGDTP